MQVLVPGGEEILFPARREAGKRNPRRKAVIAGNVARVADVVPRVTLWTRTSFPQHMR